MRLATIFTAQYVPRKKTITSSSTFWSWMNSALSLKTICKAQDMRAKYVIDVTPFTTNILIYHAFMTVYYEFNVLSIQIVDKIGSFHVSRYQLNNSQVCTGISVGPKHPCAVFLVKWIIFYVSILYTHTYR